MKASMNYMKAVAIYIALWVQASALAWSDPRAGATVHVINGMKAGLVGELSVGCMLRSGMLRPQRPAPGQEFNWKYPAGEIPVYYCEFSWGSKRVLASSYVDLGSDLEIVDQVCYKATEEGVYLKTNIKVDWTLTHPWPNPLIS